MTGNPYLSYIILHNSLSCDKIVYLIMLYNITSHKIVVVYFIIVYHLLNTSKSCYNITSITSCISSHTPHTHTNPHTRTPTPTHIRRDYIYKLVDSGKISVIVTRAENFYIENSKYNSVSSDQECPNKYSGSIIYT